MSTNATVDELIGRATALECRAALAALDGDLVAGVGGDQEIIARIVQAARNDPSSAEAIRDSVRRRFDMLETARADFFVALRGHDMQSAEATYHRYQDCLGGTDDADAALAYHAAAQHFLRRMRGRLLRRLAILMAILALFALSIGTQLKEAGKRLQAAENEFAKGEWQRTVDALEWHSSRSALLGSLGLVQLLFGSDVDRLVRAASDRLACLHLATAVRTALLDGEDEILLKLMAQFEEGCAPEIVRDIGVPLAGPLRVVTAPNAVVSILAPDGQLINRATTGEDGVRLFYLLNEGDHVVLFAKEDHESSETSVALQWGEAAEVTQRLRLKPGYVVFYGPEDTEIWLGDKMAGSTGVRIGPLAPGQHLFLFRKADSHDSEFLARVSPGEVSEYEVPPMTVHTGAYDILPVLAGDTNLVLNGLGAYRIEGSDAVATNFPVRNQILPVGSYRIRVRLAKHTPRDDDIDFTISRDQTTSLLVPFSPLPARVSVAVDTPGAVIDMEGSPVPEIGQEMLLTPGMQHRLTVSAPMHEAVEVVIPSLPPDGTYRTNLPPLIRSPPFKAVLETYHHMGNAYTKVNLSAASSNWMIAEGRDIILLVDASRRRGNWRADWAQVLRAFAINMQPRDRFQIIRFAERMEASAPDFADAEAFAWDRAEQLLRRPPLGVDSDLFAALKRITEDRNKMVVNRPLFVFVLTDGFPTTGLLSQLQMLESIDTLNRKGLLVYGLIRASPERSLFDLLSHRTGGETLFVDDLASLPLHITQFLRMKSDVGMSGVALTVKGNEGVAFVTPKLLGDVCLLQGAEFYLMTSAEVSEVVVRFSGFSGGRAVHQDIKIKFASAGPGDPEIANRWASLALRDLYWDLIETISAHPERLPGKEADNLRSRIAQLQSSYSIEPRNRKQVYPFADLKSAPRR